MEIDERHVEWAAVARMRDMLKSVRRDYEVTQTYTLFTGILCWVMQRVRWRSDPTELAPRIRHLRQGLEGSQFPDFAHLVRPSLVEVGRAERVRFNDFSEFAAAGAPLEALSVLVALRNAVAHGDVRRVVPVNQGGRLVGYRLTCTSEQQGWTASVALDRLGMAAIADELALRFCEAVIDPRDGSSIAAASQLREAG